MSVVKANEGTETDVPVSFRLSKSIKVVLGVAKSPFYFFTEASTSVKGEPTCYIDHTERQRKQKNKKQKTGP